MVVTEALARGPPGGRDARRRAARGARRGSATDAGPACWCRPTTPARPGRGAAPLADRRARCATRLRRRGPRSAATTLRGWPVDQPDRVSRVLADGRRHEPPPTGWRLGPARWAVRAILALVLRLARWAPVRSSTASARSTARSLLLAAGIAVVTTVCCAWRWRLVARGLGVRPAAAERRSRPTTARSSSTRTLPGGVLGDVHRGGAPRPRRRRRRAGACAPSPGSGSPARSCRSRWRSSCCSLLPSPVRSSMPVVAAVAGSPCSAAVLLVRALPRRRSSPAATLVRTAAADLRDGLLARRAWPGIVAGVRRSPWPATSRPSWSPRAPPARPRRRSGCCRWRCWCCWPWASRRTSAGWGPREGVAAWAFGAAGLGAAQGVATAVVYGVMVLVASLPGAVVLVGGPAASGQPPAAGSARRRSTPPSWKGPPMADRPVHPAQLRHVDRRLPRQRGTERAAAALQRRRLRPGRRRAGRLRRDPGRRGHRPQRQPAAAGARARRDGTSGSPAGSRRTPTKVTVTERADLDACAQLLRHR